MPSKKQYNLVQNDDYDTRIPLHPEEAFHHGISFQAKYIGTLDVPRPTTRVEIVAAMRRIRYEFKAKGIKKKKVTVDVSVDGVRVALRKKKKKKQWIDENSLLLMHHPIYRIFYVSHDSQDLKIFSYIARDSSSDLFKCNVFKSNKKSQAMRIVRTVGQAFEVCHKLSAGAPGAAGSPGDGDGDRDGDGDEDSSVRGPLDGGDGDGDGDDDPAATERGSDRARKDTLSDPISCDSLPAEDAASLADAATAGATGAGAGDVQAGPGPPPPHAAPHAPAQRPLRLDILPPPPATSSRRSPLGCGGVGGGGETYASPLGEPLRATPGEALPSAGTPLGAHHELQLLREQLEQQAQQTQAAVAQVHLLRDQLSAETTARLEAQARTHQLLVHNKELLDHIAVLVAHLQEQERHLAAAQATNQHQHQQQQHQQQRLIQQSLTHQTPHVVTSVPQMPTAILCEAQTPTAAPAYLPAELGGADLDLLARAGLIENRSAPPASVSAAAAAVAAAAASSRPASLYDQLFHQQLLQALGAYRPPAFYPPAAAPPPLYGAPPAYRVSQASSYSGSPVLPRAAAGGATAAPEPDPPPDRQPSPLQPKHKQQQQQQQQQAAGASPTRPRKPALEATFIKPLPHTVIVACASDDLAPVSSSTTSRRKNTNTLKVGGEGAPAGRLLNGPPLISRSTSEKVPHRSELMSQVQRTAWARHTTK